jgi:hypothetical protein
MEQSITALHSCLFKLRTNNLCSVACSSILLGALIKQMDGWELCSPCPVAPFLGYSANAVAESLRTVSTPQWYEYNTYSYGFQAHPCTLQDHINPIVSAFKADMEDVALNEYFSTVL